MDLCTHCDEAVILPVYQDEDQSRALPFCCEGCLTVFSVIHQKGLGAYYELKKDSQLFKKRAPVELKNQEYKFLDDPDFQKDYTYQTSPGEKTMEFYLEGIHCLACLWLIEKLHEFVPSLLSSKLDLERSIVTVVMSEEGNFSLAASELNKLGYRPHALKRDQDTVDFQKREEHSTLKRIGVAGAAAGNIMIYAVSLYGGASEEIGKFFNLMTVLLAVPVLTYSAWPFYTSAWNSMKRKTLSIDIPISIALILGAIMGVVNLYLGVDENYFDSLTTLIFLLLLSRYFLRKVQEKGLSAQDLHYFYQSEGVLRQSATDANCFEEVHQSLIQVGDILKVRSQDFIAADGEVIEGSSLLNNSLMTGESLPVKVKVGDKVFSGTQNLEADLLVRVEKAQEDTRLGKILKNVENGWSNRSRMVDISTTVSKYFTATIFLLAIILFAVQAPLIGMEEALIRALTLLIVTCPCALALSVPLTFNRSLAMASERGIIIKNDEVLEKLALTRDIFFDKTGTLTFGRLRVENFKELAQGKQKIEDVILSLEHYSRHPVARALLDFVMTKSPSKVQVQELMEIPGKGVTGKIEGHLYRIDKNGIHEDDRLLATFTVRDSLRPDSKEILKNLSLDGHRLKILSGDNQKVVSELVKEAGLSEESALSGMSPEEKCDLVRKTPHSVMVGDGANDAMALEAAFVGVAVCGAMDISLRAADVYLTSPGLKGVEKLLGISTETMKVIKRNLALSLLYNLVSVVLVFMGIINPLVAAIIMPISSVTVLVSCIVGTKKLRHVWKS